MIIDAKMKFDTGVAYYNDLKQSMILHTDIPSLKFIPQNYNEILLSFDKHCSNQKIAIVGIYNILIRKYRETFLKSRKRKHHTKSDEENNNNNGQAALAATTTTLLQKVTRFNCLPENITDCNSVPVKIAFLIYGLGAHNDTIKRDMLLLAINQELNDHSMDELIELCQKASPDLRMLAKDSKKQRTSTEEQRKILISALIELSAMTRDRLCSKLAFEISNTGYISLVGEYMRKHNINELATFEPLINKYLHDCVPLMRQESERQIILNQFRVSAKSVIQDIITQIPPPQQATTKQSNAQIIKKLQFENESQYEYYKGVQNFARDIITSAYNHNGNVYFIQTYNDCLYDVIGCSSNTATSTSTNITNGAATATATTPKDQNNTHNTNSANSFSNCKDEIYLKSMTWSERLKRLPFRTKVQINIDNGRVLNELITQFDLAVSKIDSKSNHNSSLGSGGGGGVYNKRIYKKRPSNIKK